MLVAVFAVLMLGLLQAPLSLIGVMAAIARRVTRDMIATTTVAATPTPGAMVIAATPAAAVTVRVAMVGAAVMMAMAATARPTGEGLADC